MRFVEIVCCLVLVGWPVSDTAVQAQSPGAAEPDARSRVGTPVPDAASRCDRALSVAVADSATTLPISQVAVRLHPLGRETGSASGADPRHRDEPAVGASPRTRTAFTDPNGIARFADLCPGSYEIETIHVGYLPHRATVSIPRAPENSPGTDGAASLRLALTSRVYAMEEVDVRAETVAPLVSLERSSHLLPSEPVKPFVSYGLADAIALVPGVLVSGERIFFRGVATEHVATTIDGVPARDPITGDWILPPPQAVAGAELIASTVVETTPTLGGLLALHLTDGGGVRATRVTYGTDAGLGSERRRIDTVTASTSGPTTMPGLSYAGSYRGVLRSTELAFDRALPEQSFLGIGTWGRRMSGAEAGSFKLSWIPEASRASGGWRADAAIVGTKERGKAYRETYARSGWVGYSVQADRYTQFLDHPSANTDIFYEGPRHVPIEENRRLLAYVDAARDLGGRGRMRAYLFHGRYDVDTKHDGVRLDDENALEQWEREELTSPNHQEDAFYALYGDLPIHTRARSRELGAGVAGQWQAAPGHDLRAGASVIRGRHRYLSVVPAPVWWIGSFETPLEVFEGSGYVQDTWKSDAHSWVQLALRYDVRRVGWMDRTSTAARWSPVLAFHQPMTAVDALHVEAGQSYQFPALQSHFPVRFQSPAPPTLQAQRVRFVELGVQHHFSRRAVVFLGARDRQYTDVVFATRTPTAAEILTGSRDTPPSSLEQRELEISLDLQLTAALTGQTSVVWSRTTADQIAGETREVPWSRRGYLRSWLVWRGGHGLSSTLSWSWDSGRPYDLCLIGRGCASWQRIRGRLPSQTQTDWAGAWETRFAGTDWELSLEIHNVLDQRPPSYDFSAFPMGITADNFLAYWDETGETDGYLIDNGNARVARGVHNPQTRVLGRTMLAAVGVRF